MAKLNSSGGLQWNTFLGSSGNDVGYGLTVDTSGNIFITGTSYATWGAPIHAYSGGADAFVAKIRDVRDDAAITVVKLPRTGQTRCWNSSGSEILCAGTGQDGDILAGATWPNPRFTVNGDCVTDNLTGLMWAKDANLPNGNLSWQGALDYVASLNSGSGLCGQHDWRLPNVNELESMVNADLPNSATWLSTQGFNKVQTDFYWSSSSDAVFANNVAWIVDMPNGFVIATEKYKNEYVWPVRSGQVYAPPVPSLGNRADRLLQHSRERQKLFRDR